MRRVLVAIAALLVVLAPLASPAAHAEEEERVTSLAAAFDIRADGTIQVRYELDWNFGVTGRHGIEFGIATRERWDTLQDVTYGVENVQVTSPSGAPADFTTMTRGSNSFEDLRLRIGDPKVALDVTTATYVITYELTGALRTFDGAPQLHWDVTSSNYPPIEKFSVTVTSPSGAVSARCLVGDKECAAAVDGSVATLTGGRIGKYQTLTAVVGMAAGAVAVAEPRLEERRVSDTTLVAADGEVTVTADGRAAVQQTLTYLFPAGREHEVALTIPVRRSWPDQTESIQRFDVEGLRITTADGTELTGSADPWRVNQDNVDDNLRVRPSTAGNREDVTVAYEVAGAAYTVDGTSTFEWPFLPFLESGVDADLVWRFPGPVTSVECVDRSYVGAAPCELTATSSGDEVRVTGRYSLPTSPRDHLRVTLAPGSITAGPLLGPNAARATREQNQQGMWLGAVTLAAAAGLTALLRRVTAPRDRRFIDVAPGLVGTTVGPDRNLPVAVRFDAPELDLATAGLLRDGEWKPAHTAAQLTQLAVDGLVVLGSDPLSVVRGDVDASEAETDPPPRVMRSGTAQPDAWRARAVRLRQELVDLADEESDGATSTATLRSMNQAVDRAQNAARQDRSLFQGTALDGGRTLVHAAVAPLLIVAGMIVVAALSDVLRGWSMFIILGLVFGGLAGVLFSRTKNRQPLAAGGTAWRDQVRSFELFIETAEADQLNVEADLDIYRAYLPWAVLFDLTERWTRVCQQLAAAGRIPPLDTSFFVGDEAQLDISAALSAVQQSMRVAAIQAPVIAAPSSGMPPSNPFSGFGGGGFSSSGGAGSSSGFSSGSSGGSGGGGTSASSW